MRIKVEIKHPIMEISITNNRLELCNQKIKMCMNQRDTKHKIKMSNTEDSTVIIPFSMRDKIIR